MNPRLKLVITIVIALLLLALFFWAASTISSLTGYSITGSSVVITEGVGPQINGDIDSETEDVLVNKLERNLNGS